MFVLWHIKELGINNSLKLAEFRLQYNLHSALGYSPFELVKEIEEFKGGIITVTPLSVSAIERSSNMAKHRRNQANSHCLDKY